MKKIIAMTLSMLMICLALAGCGRSSNTSRGDGSPADSAAKTTDNNPGAPAAQPNQPQNLSESYMAFIEIKSDLFSRVSSGLSESQSAAGLELLGMSLVDLYLVPILAMGMDETYAKASLSYLNATDVKYTADGNHYTVTYTGADGIQMGCEATYDPAKDAASTKVTQSGKESLIFEYLKTSYGYASQYYTKNDDGTYTIYKGTFYDGKDGVIGSTSNAAAQPASIVGGAEVSKDFPKDCDSWFEAKGTAGTGKASDGTTFDFTIPDEASN